jgi:exopolysaccharide production protein ExoQ
MESLLSVSKERQSSLSERIFAVVAILFSTGAFGSLWFTAEQVANVGAGETWLQLSWGAIYACSILLLWRHCSGCFQRLLKERWVLALVGLTLCSSFWSEAPATTLRHGVAIAAGCLFALYLAERFTPTEQLKLLGSAFALAAVLSFIFGAFNWGTSVFEVQGTWIGIYAHKNVLGRTMAMGALVFSLLSEHLERGKWFARIALVSCLILIILSQSMTAMVVVLLFLYAKHLIRLAIQAGGRMRRRVYATILLLGLGIPWIVNSFDRITQLLDRDPTLTGRTAVWGLVFAMGMNRPWLGHGYGGFWLADNGPSIEVWQILGTAIPGAHNGLIDLFLDLGLIGVLIAIVGYVSYLRKALHVFAIERTWDCAWPLLFLIALLLLNLTESNFLAPNFFYWFAYVAAALRVSRQMAMLRTHPVSLPVVTAQESDAPSR